jgi:hypothetical protein
MTLGTAVLEDSNLISNGSPTAGGNLIQYWNHSIHVTAPGTTSDHFTLRGKASIEG